jgi:hypothetical protein
VNAAHTLLNLASEQVPGLVVCPPSAKDDAAAPAKEPGYARHHCADNDTDVSTSGSFDNQKRFPNLVDALDACDLNLPAIEGAFLLLTAAQESDIELGEDTLGPFLFHFAEVTRELRSKMRALSVSTAPAETEGQIKWAGGDGLR